MRVYFDTSGLNQLLDDDSRDVVVQALMQRTSVGISAVNVVEALNTANPERRTALLRLMKVLAGGANLMDFPNTIVREIYRSLRGGRAGENRY